jgi:hypothetical protein
MNVIPAFTSAVPALAVPALAVTASAVPAFTRKGWIAWKVRPGMDPLLGEQTLLKGAMMYAEAIDKGLVEEDAQEYAEQELFKEVYRVGYASLGNIMTASVKQKNSKACKK